MGRLDGAGASKLSRRLAGSEQGTGGLEGLTDRRGGKKRNKSFRMAPRDLVRLEGLVERVGAATGRRVAVATLLGGALLLAERASVEDLVAAIKDADWE